MAPAPAKRQADEGEDVGEIQLLRRVYFGKAVTAQTLASLRKDGYVKGKGITREGVQHLIDAGTLHESHLLDFKEGDEADEAEEPQPEAEPDDLAPLVLDGTVGAVLEHAANSEDAVALRALVDAENQRERPRVTLIEGLERRIAQLEAEDEDDGDEGDDDTDDTDDAETKE